MVMGLSPVAPQRMAPPVISNDRPAYMITDEKGFYGPDDRLYEPGMMIYWDKEPNQNMTPLNDLAREKMKNYLAKLDIEGRKVAEKNGKSFVGLEDAFNQSLALMTNEAKQVQVIGELAQIPLMGAKKDGHTKVALIQAGETAAPLLGSPKSPEDSARQKKVDAMAKARAAKTSNKEAAEKAAVNNAPNKSYYKGVKPQSNSAE